MKTDDLIRLTYEAIHSLDLEKKLRVANPGNFGNRNISYDVYT
jgi:hypothetical protein